MSLFDNSKFFFNLFLKMLCSDDFDEVRGKSFCNFVVDGEDDTIYMDHRWRTIEVRPHVIVWFTIPDMMEFRCEFFESGVPTGAHMASDILARFNYGEFEQTFKPVLSNGATIEQCEYKLMLVALHVKDIPIDLV